MNVLQLENKLSSLNIFPTAREICRIIGMAEESYSRKKKAGTDIKFADLKKLEQEYDITLVDNNKFPSSTINIPPICASCGTGVINADIDYLQLDNKQKYIYCFANGDSMMPDIKSGDCCIIQLQETIDRQNDIYFFTYSNEQYLKRLSKNLNQLIISSDNKKYPDIILKEQELDAIRVIGRCVGVIRKL